MSVEMVVLRGRACDSNDPMLRTGEKQTSILRLTRTHELSEVVSRWLEQGRKVDAITVYV